MSMTGSDSNSSPLPRIYCGSEWHMRKNPRAHMIYSLALHITKGGKNTFYLSQGQLAQYFHWDRKTVRLACQALVQAGLFVLVQRGRGGIGLTNTANVYRVLTHAKLAALGTKQCWVRAVEEDQDRAAGYSTYR